MYCRVVGGACLLIGLFGTTFGTGSYSARAAESKTEWKAGTASVVITPERPMWMAGYASRNKPSEGKVHDLTARALAFEDSEGSRLVVVTLDLVSITRETRNWLEKQVDRAYELRPEALLVNASHTHCGPEVRPNKIYLPKDQAEQCRKYVDRLQDELLKVVGRALDDLSPVSLSYTHARAGFSMNRRTPTEKGFRNHPYPDGPVDQEVPVLLVKGADGKLKAVLFGYACHSTTLGFYQFCGDYAGFAKQYLEESHPGMMALFMAGCGGDQNPYPRRELQMCEQHGRALANGVEAALQTTAKLVRGPLRTALDEVVLEFATPPGREQLEREAQSKNKWERLHAEALLEELEEAGEIRTTYSTLVQVVRFGPDLTMVALPGEAVVDYSLRLKSELAGPSVWVAGYCNDVFGYLPSVRVLNEGGYEGGGAMRYTAFPGPFKPSVESIVIEKVHELAKKTQIPKSTVVGGLPTRQRARQSH
jgi:neutral/alkaline ceramidase-like enzyme